MPSVDDHPQPQPQRHLGPPVARLLPPEEWDKLAGTELGGQTDRLSPDASAIIVVELGGPGGPIVACWAAMNIVHVEGVWVAPGSHAGVVRALLEQMSSYLTTCGVREVLTQATEPGVADIIDRLGGHKVPGETWVIPIADLKLDRLEGT